MLPRRSRLRLSSHSPTASARQTSSSRGRPSLRPLRWGMRLFVASRHRGTPDVVQIYDTTLRDGAQGEGVNFSLHDKLRIMRKLDDLGIHYIEGGWPGSNLKDAAFFAEAKTLALQRAKLVAFGCTRRAKLKAEDEPLLQNLLEAETPVVTIFGKSWGLH